MTIADRDISLSPPGIKRLKTRAQPLPLLSTTIFGSRAGMQILFLAVAGLSLASAATAADVPLSTSYGTPSGCAVGAGQTSSPGDTTVVTAGRVRFDNMICPFTSASENSSGSWEVTLSCARGHDEELPGRIRITEDKAAGSISVELVSGIGPDGAFEACSR